MDTPLSPTSRPAVLWQVPGTVQCGFPSPAEDHQNARLDVRELLVRQPDATFFMRVRGSSMRDAGIEDGDYVVVDRSITPRHGHIVIAVVDGEFTVKRLAKRGGRVKLQAANPTFPDIVLHNGQDLTVWGVVTWTLKHHVGSR